jgi:lipopolysaccharide transport system ATP-binding protein
MFSIRAHELSKQYRIGHLRGAGYDTLRESLMRQTATLFSRGGGETTETIWALRDASFEVHEGEVVGIIGRNGAGKTTLLRLLSRITEPTRGYADIRGRVGTLLEVGTGFHPELTGRENVFLNGAILGMRRTEVVRKFDEIVEFAGVEKFLDTPVKRYSSGMYVRLAFAVAAHLEPEVLLVDEVLAVGDTEFQKRCLGKIEGFGQSGRTVLFVSHSMPIMARLCERLILLEDGRIAADGDPETVIGQYLLAASGTAAHREWDGRSAPGNELVRLRSVRVVDSSLETRESVDVREEVGIELSFDVLREGGQFVPWLDLSRDDGTLVFSAMDTDRRWREEAPVGALAAVAWIPEHLLNEGTFVASASLKTFVSGQRPIRQAEAESAVSFHVVDRGEGVTARGDFPGQIRGGVRPLLRWTTESAQSARVSVRRG